MPSSPKIPREKILRAALNLLIRDGYTALNIKSLANELECSTQPISWHFGNMEGLRQELAGYALAYCNEKMHTPPEGMKAFGKMGMAYIDIAFDEPNLFQYLYMNGSSQFAAGMNLLAFSDENRVVAEQIAKQLNITKKSAETLFLNTMIYTHGLASYIAAGLIKVKREEVWEMIKRSVQEGFIWQEGTNIELGAGHKE